jgi:cytochrome P450
MQTRLREEIRANLPSLDSGDSVTHVEIENLPYLNAVCNEVFRFMPSVPVTLREAIRETVVAGVPIPKGTVILLAPWAINKSEALWGPDANEFNPERWMGEGMSNTGGSKSNYSYLTFLHGPRSCIGQAFAKAEMKCLVAAVVGRFEFEMADKNEIVTIGGVVTSKPQNGMHLRTKVVDGW